LRTRRSNDRKQRAKLVTSAGALARLPFTIDPDKDTYAHRGFAYYGLGDPQSARASCETQPAGTRMRKASLRK
jgi:hypothetical protein